MCDLFFELVRVSLGTQDCLSIKPSVAEWDSLYRMASQQSLIGICFAGLQHLGADVENGSVDVGMDEMQYLTWMGMAAKVQRKNAVINQQCIDLQARLSADGLRVCLLKGQVNLPNYGDIGLLRQSGDIDLYVDGGRVRVLDYLHSLGMKDLKWDYVHTHAPFFEDTEVEVHYRAGAVRNLWKNRRLQRFWKENEDEFFASQAALPCGVVICPSSRMHLFYMIQHAYRHILAGGIGLRQMMDIYFALQSRHSSDDDWLKLQIRTFGMSEFAEAMVWVMHEVFGMNLIGLPWCPNENEGRFLLDEIMKSGNFGKSDNRFGIGSSKGAILLQIVRRNWHLASHYGSDALAAPFYYVWHFCWKRLHGA